MKSFFETYKFVLFYATGLGMTLPLAVVSQGVALKIRNTLKAEREPAYRLKVLLRSLIVAQYLWTALVGMVGIRFFLIGLDEAPDDWFDDLIVGTFAASLAYLPVPLLMQWIFRAGRVREQSTIEPSVQGPAGGGEGV